MAVRWVSFGTAVPFWSSDLAVARHLPHGRSQAGTATSITGTGTTSLADQLGVSHNTVARVWAEHDLKPWRTETFKFSTDPQLEVRVRDVVGLYLDPPERAIVVCVDEKSQIEALDAPPRPAAAPGQP